MCIYIYIYSICMTTYVMYNTYIYIYSFWRHGHVCAELNTSDANQIKSMCAFYASRSGNGKNYPQKKRNTHQPQLSRLLCTCLCFSLCLNLLAEVLFQGLMGSTEAPANAKVHNAFLTSERFRSMNATNCRSVIHTLCLSHKKLLQL